MPVLRDNHPSNSVLTVGSTFQAVSLPSNSRIPATYTLTATAAVALNATSMQISSNVAFKLYANTELRFGSTLVVVTATTNLLTTAVAVPILPAPSAITINTTATTVGWAGLLGIQDMSEDSKSSLISIRSMASGRYNDQRVTMIDESLSFSGWYHLQDNAMNDILKPAARNGTEIYFQAQYTDGETIVGIGVVSNLSRQAKLDDVQKYSYTLNVNGTPTWGSVLTPVM